MESRLDALAKALAQSGSRREALRRLAGAVGAVALTAVGVSCSPDDLVGPKRVAAGPLFATGRCKKNDHKCRENDECCSGLCNPLTGVCGCEAGMITCPVSGQCVPACSPEKVLNPNTCTCECPTGTTVCSDTCCTGGSLCCNGVCKPPCGTQGCCSSNETCCGTTCSNTSSDPNNCGICGRVCAAPFSACQGGNCACPPQNICTTLFFGTQCCFPSQICDSFAGCLGTP